MWRLRASAQLCTRARARSGDLDEHLRKRKKDSEDKEPFVIVRQLIARLEADRVAECRKRTRRCYSLKPKAFRKALAGAAGAA